MSYDTNIGSGAFNKLADLPFKQQMKLQFKDMGTRAWSSAKNFGFIGLVFTGTECSIESVSLCWYIFLALSPNFVFVF
jgi:import inner membrane translocase subunit TIM22